MHVLARVNVRATAGYVYSPISVRGKLCYYLTIRFS